MKKLWYLISKKNELILFLLYFIKNKFKSIISVKNILPRFFTLIVCKTLFHPVNVFTIK